MKAKPLFSRTFSFALILVLLVSISVIGCTQPAQITSTSAAPQAPSTAAGPKAGGVYKIASPSDPMSMGFAPRLITNFDYTIITGCVENLVTWNEKGELVPKLAESMSVDANAKTITFKLRKEVKFHDGTDCNAAAVKWNLEKFMAAGRNEIPKTTAIDAVDDYTVRLTLTAWDNTIPTNIAIYAGYIVSPTAWKNAPGAASDQDRDAWSMNNPVGTGPFQFVSWQKSAKITFKKFANYWQKGKPYLDGVEWNIIADPMTAEAAFKAKEIDASIYISPSSAKNLAAAGYKILKCTDGNLQCMSVIPNSLDTNQPFSNVTVRKALNYAIDKKAITSAIYGDWGIPVDQLAIPGGNRNSPDFKGYSFDPEKAKQLLAEAGYANGLKAKMMYRNLPDDVAYATALQSMFAKANITLTMDSVSVAAHMQATSPKGSFESLILKPLGVDNGDQLGRFVIQFGSNATQHLTTTVKIPELDQMLADARQVADPSQKIKMIQGLQQMIFEKYCLATPITIITPLMSQQSYVQDGKFFVGAQTQWDAESLWLNK